jgi:hypothetical protein
MDTQFGVTKVIFKLFLEPKRDGFSWWDVVRSCPGVSDIKLFFVTDAPFKQKNVCQAVRKDLLSRIK